MKAFPEQIEWLDDRFYKIKLEDATHYLASVTTILNIISKPFIATWRGEVGNQRANEVMNEALDRGSRVHHASYIYTQGGIVLNDSWKTKTFNDESRVELHKAYNGRMIILKQEEFLTFHRFVQMLNVLKPQIHYAEATIYSIEERYAGTLDYVFEIEAGEYMIGGSKPLTLESGIYLVDLKTGKSIDDGYFMQLGAYDHLIQEEFDVEDIKGALLVHLDATTKSGIEGLKAHFRSREELDQDYSDFLKARDLWYRNNKATKPKVFELPTYATMYPELIQIEDEQKEQEKEKETSK